MKVSIITATFNRSLQLKRGLMTILRQENLPADLEIIIVDDGSKDDTQSVVEYLKEEFMRINPAIEIKYIYLDYPEPRISCIPRNIGIKQAGGDIVIFTESEGLHISNTISQLLTKMEEYPDNTILASQVWSMGQRIYEKLTDEEFRYPARILSHPYAFLTNNEFPENKKAPNSDFAITGEMNCNAGVLFACRKQWLLDIGGFDEEFTEFGFDDFDLFNRLAKYGKGILKCPDIAIIHQYHIKNYPYNIIEAGERNGAKSAQNIAQGKIVANQSKEWGQI